MASRKIYTEADRNLFHQTKKCKCGVSATLEYDWRWKLFAYFCKKCSRAWWARVKGSK